jgi:hypothetical protein
MAKLTTPADTANLLTVRDRLLLFCAASGTDWEHAGITGGTVTAMIVKRLIVRDAGELLTPLAGDLSSDLRSMRLARSARRALPISREPPCAPPGTDAVGKLQPPRRSFQFGD